MPFTLAHPAVVLPLSSNYWHKPALILGSMSPDFVYFLQGQPSSNIGHTGWGFFAINLPLYGLIFYGYQQFIMPYFWQNLLAFLQINFLENQKESVFLTTLIFCFSAIVGMLTHVFLDSFTHPTGWFVQYFATFQQVFFGLALYKWLQYLGGILGLMVIAGYWLYLAKQNVMKSDIEQKAKFFYWLIVSSITGFLLLIWQLLQPIGLSLIVNWVIRGMDCGFLALVLLGIYLKFLANKKGL